MLEIVASNLHWLGVTDEGVHDLCAHGGVRVSLDGELLVEDVSDYAVSTGALHLLRTLEADHTSSRTGVGDEGEQLIPCCGHFMHVPPGSDRLWNLGCPEGVNWWVRHESEHVELDFPNGRRCTVTAQEWRRAVMAFSAQVWAFFAATPAKQPGDAWEAEWLPLFLKEWMTRGGHARPDTVGGAGPDSS